MNVVFIYGPPAAGKLTVAKALAELTGYKVLHNHMKSLSEDLDVCLATADEGTGDLAQEFFAFHSPEWSKLHNRLRLDIVEALAEEGISVVTTFAYTPTTRMRSEKMEEVVASAGGLVYRVHLAPTLEELERRVLSPERTGTRRAHDVELLRSILLRDNSYGNVHSDDLSIDNTSISAEEVAAQIASHYGLLSEIDPEFENGC